MSRTDIVIACVWFGLLCVALSAINTVIAKIDNRIVILEHICMPDAEQDWVNRKLREQQGKRDYKSETESQKEFKK